MPRLPRRAVSYIVSVMIMTLVTVSIASGVYFWSLQQTQQSQNQFGLAITARIEKTQERLVVEDVQFVNSSTIIIYVRNVGGIEMVVDRVYVDSKVASALSPQKRTLNIQESNSITVTAPSGMTFTAGQTYYVVVATTRGSTHAAYWTY